MEIENIVRLTTQGLLLCLYLSLPAVAAASIIGLIVSFIQAITSLQDQTILFGIKLIVVIVTVIVIAPWGASSMLRFANELVRVAVPT